MRKNQAILDEAARSVRRTFIGSVAGSVTMLGVVGAAGAYGVPDSLNAQALSSALVSLHVKISPSFARAGQVAVSIGSDDEIVLPVPQPSKTEAAPANKVAETALPVSDAAPVEPAEATAPPVAAAPAMPDPVLSEPVLSEPALPPQRRMPFAMPAAAGPLAVAVPASAPVEREATAAVPAAREAEAVAKTVAKTVAKAEAKPEPKPEASAVPAALVFEPPQLDKIKPMTELPKTVIVDQPPKAAPAPVQAAKPAPAKPEAAKPKKTSEVVAPEAAVTTGPAELVVDETPKVVEVRLPVPKPKPTPAQLLDLTGKDYDKAERCLAQAIYFEARAEPVRGQQAVAQVVLNRVFSPYYPKDVCSVVYQNAHRHLSCQFTFACDGKPEAIRERGAWARANRIAKQSLDAKVWLPEVAKATHYHATYVRPNWIRDMRVMVKHGVHIFYRPRNWGDGQNEPGWGSAAAAPATPAPVKVAHRKGARS